MTSPLVSKLAAVEAVRAVITRDAYLESDVYAAIEALPEIVPAAALGPQRKRVVVCENGRLPRQVAVLAEFEGGTVRLVEIRHGNLIALPPLDGHRCSVWIVEEEGEK